MKKIVVFQGGLGNQLFQYAIYEFVKHNICPDVRYVYRGKAHNGMELQKFFLADIRPAPVVYSKLLLGLDILKRHGFKLLMSGENDEKPFSNLYVEGYWLTKKYLHPKLYHFREISLSERNKTILHEIEESESVAIHVRRGDYLQPQYKDIYGNVCTVDYYDKALRMTKNRFRNPRYFVFSDDIFWCMNHLHIGEDACFVDWNTKDKSFYDMYLMAHAKANVMANSTFSFWAAYLNENNPLVVYPKKWYNTHFAPPDFFKNDWVGI